MHTLRWTFFASSSHSESAAATSACLSMINLSRITSWRCRSSCKACQDTYGSVPSDRRIAHTIVGAIPQSTITGTQYLSSGIFLVLNHCHKHTSSIFAIILSSSAASLSRPSWRNVSATWTRIVVTRVDLHSAVQTCNTR